MKLGVIGGLGPLASAYFYELLTVMNDVDNDQDHLETIIYSCPSIPDRTAYILDNTLENPVHKMTEVGKALEMHDISLIAIPCITGHYFYPELTQALDTPIVHLIKEVGDYLERNHYEKVGLMATDGTITSRIFQNELESRGIEVVTPTKTNQRKVMRVIYNDVKSGKPIEQELFYEASGDLYVQGAEIIILGCTELSIVKKELHLNKVDYIDVMDVLSAVSLMRCGQKLKKEYTYLVE